ncbi:MAG: PQQ-binding-like beta-propeller repeat protein [Planctomycetaceae bacterium]|nr:PQQ-binding-like beta-propeller repeat protein [Planctomycetaceae bacterium]
MLRCTCLLLSLVAAIAGANDDPKSVFLRNWPQWRGPLNTGEAPSADPPLNWSETDSVRWKVEIPGEGSGTAAVWEDRVFVMTAIETDRPAEHPPAADEGARTKPPVNLYQFVVICLDRQTGETLWQRVARENVPREGRHATNTYASASPITDGERIWCSFGSQGLYCFDIDGNLIWDRDLGEMRTRRGWGEGATPARGGDVIVVPWDREEDSFVAALDARTGDELWRRERDEPTGWSTPLIIDRGDGQQAILNGTNRVRSYDLSSGELLWECGGQTVNAIPSPVADQRQVYVMSGYQGSHAAAVSVDADGDVTGSPQVSWTVDRGTPYVPSPVLLDGRLYYTAVNANVLTCVNAQTGQVLFGPERLPGVANLYGSPVAAAGRIYFTSREGVTTVITAGDQFEVLATNRLDEGFDASPAVAGTQIFLRGKSHLYCLEANPTR